MPIAGKEETANNVALPCCLPGQSQWNPRILLLHAHVSSSGLTLSAERKQQWETQRHPLRPRRSRCHELHWRWSSLLEHSNTFMVWRMLGHRSMHYRPLLLSAVQITQLRWNRIKLPLVIPAFSWRFTTTRFDGTWIRSTADIYTKQLTESSSR